MKCTICRDWMEHRAKCRICKTWMEHADGQSPPKHHHHQETGRPSRASDHRIDEVEELQRDNRRLRRENEDYFDRLGNQAERIGKLSRDRERFLKESQDTASEARLQRLEIDELRNELEYQSHKSELLRRELAVRGRARSRQRDSNGLVNVPDERLRRVIRAYELRRDTGTVNQDDDRLTTEKPGPRKQPEREKGKAGLTPTAPLITDATQNDVMNAEPTTPPPMEEEATVMNVDNGPHHSKSGLLLRKQNQPAGKLLQIPLRSH